MTKKEWIPVSKKTPCPVCGKETWCSVSRTEQNFTTCKRTSTAPSGWTKLKETADGGGVYKPIDSQILGLIDNNQRSGATDIEAQTETEKEWIPVNNTIRNQVYRRLIHKNGHLSNLYREDLLFRGLSNENINEAIERGWFANWQRGISSDFASDSENIAGINPARGLTGSCDGMFLTAIRDGHIIGGQIYPKIHVQHRLGQAVDLPDDLGKYIWLSSNKQGGVGAHSFETGETPLFLREHPEIQLEDIENLNLCEGALKSAIATLKAEARGCYEPFLGASGAIFSEGELRLCLARYPNLKTVTLWPDAGGIQNPDIMGKYQRAIERVKKLTDGKVTALVAWWSQSTKEARDVDELTEKDFANLIIEPWENSIMAETAPTSTPEKAEDRKPHFTSSIEAGLVKNELDAEGCWKKPTRIGDHLECLACVDNPEQDGAALLLEFYARRGKKGVRRWTMPCAELAGEGVEICRELSTRGYVFERCHRRLLLDFINKLGVEAERTYTVTDTTGWIDRSFVTPHKTYGDETLRFRDVEPTKDTPAEIVGTLEDWKSQVAAKCAANSRLILGLGAAFAAPLLPLVGMESGGFHLVGTTSEGKTTVLKVAASVTGAKEIPTWRTTVNGLESIATAHNHSVMPLDEINQAGDPKQVGEVAYMLGNGQGKARMTKQLTSRKPKVWNLIFLSSGEVGMVEFMQQAGIPVKGGQEVRMPSVPAVPKGSVLGAFETIHGAGDSQQFAEDIERAIKKNRGTALDTFLTRLVVDAADKKFSGILTARVAEISRKFAEGTTTHAIGRVANRFALLQVALELAHSYDLLPFPIEHIEWGIKKIFTDWLSYRGGDGSIEIKRACDRIERLFAVHEFGERVYTMPDNDGRQVRSLLAYRDIYRKKDGVSEEMIGQTKEFWVPQSIFKQEFCEGVNEAELVKELQIRDWLLPTRQNGVIKYQRKVKGQRVYFYVFRKWRKDDESDESDEIGTYNLLSPRLIVSAPPTHIGKHTNEFNESTSQVQPPWTHLTHRDSCGDESTSQHWNPLPEKISEAISSDSSDSCEKTHRGLLGRKDDQKALKIMLFEQMNDEYFTPGDFDHE
jgi:putative DNA primase/helicase